MINSLKYPSLVAKLKGMKAKNLTKTDIEDLLKQNNLVSVNNILKQKNYHLSGLEDNFDRIKIENELNKILIDDIEKIYKYLSSKDKEKLRIYVSEYEIDILIRILKKIKLSKIEDSEIQNIELWTERIFKELKGITRINTINEFLQYADKTDFKELLEENLKDKNINDVDLFMLEMKLDILYFENVFKNIKDASSSKLIKDKIELTNIIWIYRMKKFYNMETDEISSNIVKTDKQSTLIQEIIKQNDCENIIEILKKSKYKNIFKEDEKYFENYAKRYMYRKYKKIFEQGKYNFSTIIAYLNLDEILIENIINIVGGIEYEIDKKLIQEKIII